MPSLARCVYPWSEVISSRDLLAPPDINGLLIEGEADTNAAAR